MVLRPSRTHEGEQDALRQPPRSQPPAEEGRESVSGVVAPSNPPQAASSTRHVGDSPQPTPLHPADSHGVGHGHVPPPPPQPKAPTAAAEWEDLLRPHEDPTEQHAVMERIDQLLLRETPPSVLGVRHCPVCECDVNGLENWIQHMSCEAHRRGVLRTAIGTNRVTAPQEDAELVNPGNFYKCEVCGVTVSGPENYEQHLNGKQHARRLREKQLLQRLQRRPDVDMATRRVIVPGSHPNPYGFSTCATSSGNSDSIDWSFDGVTNSSYRPPSEIPTALLYL